MPSQTKTALITGANKGIGFEVARQLGNAGFSVLLGARNLTLGEQAAASLRAEEIDVRAVEIDITRPETIAAAAATIPALDVLVNNAGIVDPADGPPTTTTVDALDNTLRTNFIGAVAVTQAMLPMLRQAASARIVNVSSGLGSLTLNGDLAWPHVGVKFLAYSASKAALNMFTVQLAYELRETNIKVNSADPGYTKTDLNHNRGTQTIEEGAAETIRLVLLRDDGPTGTFSANEGPNPW
jgi:NAD(P)-dependent dehydrogenase (short-subunit alcohol dehydrogenase family)